MYNRELQKINNQYKAYLLGLFYADGNISLNQTHCRIALHEQDVEVLNSIKTKFNFFKMYQDKNKHQFILYSGYALIKKDLISNGCFPQKSTINKNITKLPKLKNNLIRHFIRGYFDGDGGCYLDINSNKIQKRVYIYSASKNLLEEISNILRQNNIVSILRNSREDLYILQISTVSYKEFYNYLYIRATIKMRRKVDKFKTILKTNFFIQKVAPNCTICKSKNTVFNGKYTYKNVVKPRVFCKNCKNNYIIQSAPVSSNINSGEDELLES